MIPFFSDFSRRILLVYTVVLLLLGAYSYHLYREDQRREVIYKDYLDSLLILTKKVSQATRFHYSNILKWGEAYRDSQSVLIYNQARSLEKMKATMLSSLELELSNITNISLQNIQIEKPDEDVLSQSVFSFGQFALYVDSLRYIAKNNAIGDAYIEMYFSEDKVKEIKSILASAPLHQKGLLLAGLRLDILDVTNKIMIEMRRVQQDSVPVLNNVPFINLKNTCLKKGDFAEGEIYIMQYRPHDDNIEISVDGIHLINNDGVGKFEMVTSPKKKTIAVGINKTNPLTHASDYYTKSFNVGVCK